MKTTTIFVHCLFVMMVLANYIDMRAQSNKITSTVSGVVVDASTQQPLSAANVLVLGTTLGASTDDRGRFIIEKVPVGRYAVAARILGYEPAYNPIFSLYQNGQHK